MRVMSYTESRAHYAAVLDTVIEDRETVVVTRAGRPAVAMIALDELEALQETAYLLRSPANASRLLESISQLEAGQGRERALSDE